MIDRASARTGHFAVGDPVTILLAGQARVFTISGITGYGSADSFAGGSLALFSLPAAQRLFGTAGSYDSIEVKAAAGVSAQQLRDRVARILPRGVTALTAASAAANQANQLNGQLSILTRFFLVFAGVALFVGAFVIWNTFSIMVGQRTRELALLRMLGAGRGQLFRSVLAEAALVGAVAALAGVAIGVALSKGLVALLGGFGLSLPVTGTVVPLWQLALACRNGASGDLGRRDSARLAGHPGRPGPGSARCGNESRRVLLSPAGSGAGRDDGGRRAGAGRAVQRPRNGSHRNRSDGVLHRRHRARPAHRPAARSGDRFPAYPAPRQDRGPRPREHDARPEAHQRRLGRSDDRPGIDRGRCRHGRLQPDQSGPPDRDGQQDQFLRPGH
jgi:hypothetical protein